MWYTCIAIRAPSAWLQYDCHKLLILLIVAIVYFDYVQRSCNTAYCALQLVRLALHYMSEVYAYLCSFASANYLFDEFVRRCCHPVVDIVHYFFTLKLSLSGH